MNSIKIFIQDFLCYLRKFTSFVLALFIVVFTFLMVSLFVFKICKPKVEVLYKNTFIVSENNKVTIEERNHISDLIKKNRIIPVSTIYDRTINYYDSLISISSLLITFLVAALGLFSYFSWISLKSKIKEDLDKKVNEEFEKIFNSPIYKSYRTELIAQYINKNKDIIIPELASFDLDIDEVVEKVFKRIKDDRKTISLTNIEEQDGK